MSLDFAVRSKLALFALFIMSCASVGASAVAVAAMVSPGCDPEFWDALEARTWMEGEREVEVAERLILKPDSVLEYSCFNRRVGALAAAANWIFSDRVAGAPLFTAHAEWRNRNPPPPGAAGAAPFTPIHLGPVGPDPPGAAFTAVELDGYLSSTSMEPLADYLSNNFGHTLGGGSYGGPPGAVCGAMNLIWNFLRCQDFDKNLFIKLQDMPGFDPRVLPSVCPGAGARTLKWNLNLVRAFPPPSIPAALGG